MEEILYDYRSYIQSFFANANLPSGSTIAGMANRMQAYGNVIKEFNEIATKRLKEILSNNNQIDKDILEKDLRRIAVECHNEFLQANFNTKAKN